MQISLFYNPTLNKVITAIQMTVTEYMISKDGLRYSGKFVNLTDLGYELLGEFE